MSEIRFYHAENTPGEQLLPALLTKTLESGQRALIRVPDAQALKSLNEYLWTYRPESFLPHGGGKDPHPELQPIWITSDEDNPNTADILFVLGGAGLKTDEKFSLCCEILNGADAHALKESRQRWKAYKDAGHDLTYWQRTDNGWEKKDI